MKISAFLSVFLLLASVISAQSGEVFQFQHQVSAQVKQFQNDKEQMSMNYVFMFPEEEAIIGLSGMFEQAGQSMETQAIFDGHKKTLVALIDQGGMKMGMKMQLKDDERLKKLEEGMSEASIVKTGRTRTILGYNAEEYEVKDNESYSLVWMTREIEFPNFYEAMSSLNKQAKNPTGDLPEGFMLAMTSWPEGRKGNNKIEMTVTEVNRNKPTSISTEGYRIMEMPNR